MEIGFDGFSETMSVLPKRDYTRIKAHADMADELAEALRRLLIQPGYTVYRRDGKAALAKYDALKEEE